MRHKNKRQPSRIGILAGAVLVALLVALATSVIQPYLGVEPHGGVTAAMAAVAGAVYAAARLGLGSRP